MLKVRTDKGSKVVVGCIMTFPNREEHHWCNVCSLDCRNKNIPARDVVGKRPTLDIDKKEDKGDIF